MSTQAWAKAPEPKDDSLTFTMPEKEGSKFSLTVSLRIWREVIIAELLNLLEKRRYDACK